MKKIVFLFFMSLFVFTTTVNGEIIYEENFNNGLSPEWILMDNYGIGFGMIVNNNQLELITFMDELLNEAVLWIDLTGVTDITLSFDYGTNPEEVAQPLPAAFTDHYLGDGVSYSIDGTNWVTLVSSFPVTPFYTPMAPVSVEIPTSGLIVLKFQQYGATSEPGAVCIDNIIIEGTNTATGSLNVSISPPEAVSAGAQWRRTGTTPWLNSGDTETDIPTGTCDVEFKSIDDWITPANQSVTINLNSTTNASGTYVERTYYSGGTGEAIDPYQIADVDDWLELISSSGDWDKHFILISDIDFYGVFLTPMANSTAFTGVFDGNNHLFRNFTISRTGVDSLGVFGKLGNEGQIKNLGIESVYISSQDYIGGLVGINNGLIENCYVTGTVSGDSNVGGIAGHCEGFDAKIRNCYASASVSGAGSEIGGLAGSMFWAEIHDSYASGPVSGSQRTGGIVGYSEAEEPSPDPDPIPVPVEAPWLVANSFWDTETSGVADSSGGTGKTTAQMKTISTFLNAGWDFTTAWGIGHGQTYPYLKPFNGINPADIDYSGTVNMEDLAIIAANWLNQN